MTAQAMGPTYAGGSQPITQGNYQVLYLPDVNNSALQAQGDAPVFYWVPNTVRMARKDGPVTGDYLFNLVRFAGTGGDASIGGGGDVAGGVLTFSTTGALPPDVQAAAEAQITAQFRGSDDVFWGIRSAKAPMFRPAVVASCTTSVSNLAPTTRGFPTLVDVPTRGGRPRTAIRALGNPMSTAVTRDAGAAGGDAGGGPSTSAGNLDPWYCDMQGQGTGSVDPSGTHAFSGLLGKYPAAVAWEAFHGTSSPLIVIQNYLLKVWSPVATVTIDGHWDKIFEHFSAAASAHYLWASVDLKAEFNTMRENGTITVDLKVDTTLPGADAIAKKLDETSDLVFSKFMDAAKGVIFDPPAPQVEPAQASSGSGPWGVGVALKYRRDETHLDLHFQQTEQFAYLQPQTVSNSLAGMYDEMHKDPDAERKYFLSVSLDDWPRRLARVFRPVVPWSDGTVAFVSAECAYVDAQGNKLWEGHAFTGDPGEDGTWKYQTAQKALTDVTNPPPGWKPDLTFVKRKVHLNEPADETQDPYHRVQIERDVIELDPEPDGQLMNDTTLEVRADSAGRLAVGPISLGVMLTDDTQVVEVVFEPVDPDTKAPTGLGQVRFSWKQADCDEDRSWKVFTGDPTFRPFYRYQVSVTVKGTLFTPGQAWTGPWTSTAGNGPLVVQVPRPDSPGVTTRAMPDDRGVLRAPASPAAPGSPASRSVPAGLPAPKSVPEPSENGHRTYLEYQL